MADRLDRAFFAREPDTVARDLVGCTLVRTFGGTIVSGRIVETEAYGDETDLASHAAVYRRSRTQVMRATPGTVYVYRSYGVHCCFNIVAHLPGSAGAVLIRAAEPTTGMVVMAERRGSPADGSLANGPGRLAQAFALSLEDNAIDVVADDDIVISSRCTSVKVAQSARIGITRDVDRCWRFFDPFSGALSRRVATKRDPRPDAC